MSKDYYLKTLEPFTDLDKFPFGKHKGEFLQDIPAEYFQWIWNEFDHSDPRNKRILGYIKNNKSALEQELGGRLEDAQR